MSGKKKLIVLAVLGLVSFGASFFVSMKMGGGPVVDAGRPEQQEATHPILTGLPGVADMRPKEKQLGDLIRDVRKKIAAVRSRENDLRRREERIRTAHDLLLAQAKEIETLRVQLVPRLQRLKEEVQKLKDTRVEIDLQEMANLKKAATILAGMDATEGGLTIQQMCTDGRDADAVKILTRMEPKKAARIIAEIKDKSLAARLFDLMKRISEPSATQT